MTLKNFCGFESGDFAETVAGAEGSAGLAVTSSLHRTGSYCLAVNPATGSEAGYCRFSAITSAGAPTDLNLDSIYLTVGLYVDTVPSSNCPILHLENASAARVCTLMLLDSGRIAVYDIGDNQVGLSDAKFGIGAWRRLQFYADKDTGNWVLKFDNDYQVGGTNDIASGTFAKVALGMYKNIDSSTPLFYFDDLAISSSDDFSTADSNNTGVYCCTPNAAGSVSGWTSGTGSTYLEIDEIPTDGDTTYLAQTAGSTHSVNVTAPSLGTPVLGVKCWARARNTSAGSMNTRISQGASVSSGSAVSMTSSYKDFFQLQLTDPASGVAFTGSDIGSIQIGIVASTKSGNVRCTTMALMVLAHDNSVYLSPGRSNLLASTGVGGTAAAF